MFICNDYWIYVQFYQRSALGRALHIGAALTIKPPQIRFVSARDAQAFQASFWDSIYMYNHNSFAIHNKNNYIL